MTKEEYNEEFEALLNDAESLDYGWYEKARGVISDWRRFGRKYHVCLGQFTFEHINTIERDFTDSERYSQHARSVVAWNAAYQGLINDISSMRGLGKNLPDEKCPNTENKDGEQ